MADESFQEAIVRADERERVAREVKEAGNRDLERSRAVFALLLTATFTGAMLVPVWAAIIGFAVWLFRVVAGAPLPW